MPNSNEPRPRLCWCESTVGFGLVLIIVLFVGCSAPEISKPTARWLATLFDFLRTLAQVLGLIGVAFGAYFTYRRFTATDNQLEQLRGQSRIQEERQQTERYTRSIEQLANHESVVKNGGIYGLEGVAYDSERYHEPVLCVLNDLIHTSSPRPHSHEFIRSIGSEFYKCPVEVQTAMKVIGRRRVERDPKKGPTMRFRDLCLDTVILPALNFTRMMFFNIEMMLAILRETNFQGCTFTKCDLRYSCLQRAIFKDAKIDNVYFNSIRGFKVDFIGSTISDTKFIEADLRKADFSDATLTRVDFQHAKLAGAEFRGATLWDVDFSNSRGFLMDQFDGAVCNNGTIWPEGISPDMIPGLSLSTVIKANENSAEAHNNENEDTNDN